MSTASIGQVLRLALFASLAFASSLACAQAFPSKPIRIIVASAPGTIIDVIARTIGPEMANALGQPIIVENKPGAQNTIGYEYVARQAPADGYTILSALVQDVAIMPLTVKSLRFDPLQSLPPVIGLLEARNTLVVPSPSPWRSLGELAAHAKANPGKLNTGGSSALIKLLSEALFKDSLGLDVLYVPYSNAAAYSQALVVGDLHMGIASITNSIVAGQRVRVLAVTGAERSAALPDTPTFKELGHPEIRSATFSLNVRSGTPREIVEILYKAASRALSLPEVRGQFQKLKYDVIGDPPEAAARSLAEQARIYGEMAKRIGLEPE